MKESDEKTDEQLQFDFEDYATEPATLGDIDTLTVQAIAKTLESADIADDCTCIRRVYTESNGSVPAALNAANIAEEKSTYYLFKAHDAMTGRNIAVKTTNPVFSDASPEHEKRLEWESAVLSYLKNKNHIQQLVTPFRTELVELTARGETSRVRIAFFSSVFLNTDIRKSFFDSKTESLAGMAKKLRIFISIVSAVQTLHHNHICHRDIKPANIMGYRDKEKGVCSAVAIDFGSSLVPKTIQDSIRLYPPVLETSKLYAAPELLCGFSDVFSMAQSADIYALGCMLFELCDKRLYYTALCETNERAYWEAMNNILVDENDCDGDTEKRIAQYNANLDAFHIVPPVISEYTVLPDYIRDELQSVVNGMTAFDYRKRLKTDDLDGIKDKLRRIIRILDDSHLQQLHKKWREARKQKRNGRSA